MDEGPWLSSDRFSNTTSRARARLHGSSFLERGVPQNALLTGGFIAVVVVACTSGDGGDDRDERLSGGSDARGVEP